MSTELNTLFPTAKTVNIGGHDFQVRELVAAEFPLVAALGHKLADIDLLGIGPLFETESDKMFALLASITGKPLDEIKRLRMSVIADLIAAVVEENMDFFVRQLPAILARVATKARGSMQPKS